jgi:hypothetical protein
MSDRERADGAWDIQTLPQEGKLGIAFPSSAYGMTGHRLSEGPPRYALTSDQVHALISDLNRALLDLERERDRQAHELRQGYMPT